MSRKVIKSTPPKEELLQLYTKKGETISSVARFYNTNNPTVRKWLISYDITRKSHKQASTEANNRHRSSIKPTKKKLKKLYENSTIKSLQDYFNVGQETIYDWMQEYDIPIRTLSESTILGKERQYRDIQFDFETLDREYDRTKSINDLAKKLNVSRSHIRCQLINNNIAIEPIEPSYRSNAEKVLYDFLVESFPNDTWICADKKIIAPYELDIINVDKKIAIEYCGIYWHSEISNNKNKNYHKHKYAACKEQGFKLITVFETDDMDKIRCLLFKLLGKTEKVGARKTSIVKLESKTAMGFHRTHHLHSEIGGRFHYGLMRDEQLLMVASFGKNRFGKDQEYECSRITSHSNITVVGGVSKLIKHFIKTEEPKSIVTFADLRFGNGLVYKNCDFLFLEETGANYWYSYKYQSPLYSRVKFQKHKLQDQLEYYDPLKTEFENMVDNGWDRIWDCGNAKYIWQAN